MRFAGITISRYHCQTYMGRGFDGYYASVKGGVYFFLPNIKKYIKGRRAVIGENRANLKIDSKTKHISYLYKKRER